MSAAAKGVAQKIGEMVRGKSELDPALAREIAATLAQRFRAQPEDVSLLRMKPDGRELEFIVPEKLARVGTLPMTSTKSITVRTARSRTPQVSNKFAGAEHHTFFEAVPLKGKERGDPIQKIISVPIVVGQKTVGVVQVTRKGKTPGVAGPDFNQQDAAELGQVAAALATCLGADK